jgi:rhomboid family GlyGly-CTERM serine protease
MITYSLRLFACPLIVSLICLLIALLPDAWQSTLQYQRDDILSGEIWRTITGHLTHLNLQHLATNLAGFWLIWWLFFKSETPTLSCFSALSLLFIGTTLGLGLFSPEVIWYRGLSGGLHGLLVLGLLRQWSRYPLSTSLMLALFVAKLLWEQTNGAIPGSEAWIAGHVIVNSHLYGTFCGGIIWLSEYTYSQHNKREVIG